MLKYVMFPALLAASSAAHAVAVSAGTNLPASTTGASTSISSDNCPMAQTSFTLKLSQNVGAAWNCSTTAAAVNAGSTKGSTTYGGTTAGGTLSSCNSTPDATNGYGSAPSSTDSGCAAVD